MPSSPPKPLEENTGLAFIGETLWQPAQLQVREGQAFEKARNPNGRPNSDVIRHFVDVKSGHVEEHVQIDFPFHFNEQEAGLYVKPASHLRSKQTSTSLKWWLNPHANSALRTAVARLDRYLASPWNVESPAWDWIDSEHLPTATLLVVARDDDFTHGILQSRFFDVWWREYVRQISPVEIVESFPFPWPPVTLLSALTRVQEEHRLSIARCARAGDQDSLNAAVTAAYTGSADMSGQDVFARLNEFHRRRVERGQRT